MQIFDMTEDESQKAKAAYDILSAFLSYGNTKGDVEIGDVCVCAGHYYLIKEEKDVVLAKGLSCFIEESLYALTGIRYQVQEIKRSMRIAKWVESVTEETYGIFVYHMLIHEHWI